MRKPIQVIKASALAVLFGFMSGLQAATTVPAIEEKDIESIIKKVSPSVVRVEVRNGVRKVATGVVIDGNGHIVTTALVSPREDKIFVLTMGGERIEAKFLGYDSETHLAVIETKDKGLPAQPLIKGVELSPGTWIGVVGMSPENKPAVSQGIVSSVTDDTLRLNVWVVGGASGSPVVNGQGQMIGLLRGVYSEDQPLIFEFREQRAVGSGVVLSRAEAPASGMAEAVPADIVLSVVESILEKGKVERGWLGIEMGENEDGRVEIVFVDEDSPASLAKLKEGDLLLSIDGKGVTGIAMLSSEIRRRKPGQDVSLTILRDGKELKLKVKLGERPEEENQRELEKLFPRLFPAPRAMPSQPPPGYAVPKPMPPPTRDKVAPWVPFRLERRKFIGVTLEEMNPELSEFFGLKEGTGLLINSLEENSPAAKSGLKVGDVIFKADGKRVESVAELSGLIQDKKRGDKIKIEFIRSKKEMSAEVEIQQDESDAFFPGGSELSLLRELGESDSAMAEDMKEWQEKYGAQTREDLNRLIDEFKVKNKELLKEYEDNSGKPARVYSGNRVLYRI